MKKKSDNFKRRKNGRSIIRCNKNSNIIKKDTYNNDYRIIIKKRIKIKIKEQQQ